MGNEPLSRIALDAIDLCSALLQNQLAQANAILTRYPGEEDQGNLIMGIVSVLSEIAERYRRPGDLTLLQGLASHRAFLSQNG